MNFILFIQGIYGINLRTHNGTLSKTVKKPSRGSLLLALRLLSISPDHHSGIWAN